MGKLFNYIYLRISSKYDKESKEFKTTWEFLTIDGQPLGGRGANFTNVTKFLTYIRLFYLSALRDSTNEFSPRSPLWGRILKELKINEEQIKKLNEELTVLNETLLKADPKVEQVRKSLDNVQKIFALETGQNTTIQALPIKPWELMSKSEVVIRGRGSEIDFPLTCHGQGVQSLSIIFLFQAFIDVLLKPSFQQETEAILALEEPEAHLHPHAVRALAANLSRIKSQKLISSHSPYFIQEIPFTQIRLFRRSGPLSKILYVKRYFTAKVPNRPELLEFCSNNNKLKFTYNETTSILRVNGKVEKKEYRKLLEIYADQRGVHAELKKLKEESNLYLTDKELSELDTYAKRIRGEVLFARAWLLCEGQCEYLLFRYFAELLDKPLDQAGVTVIDFQNNGSPGAFVGLARAFEIPWMMVCDNDSAGKEFIKQVENRGLSPEEIKKHVKPLPEENMDIELYLVKNTDQENFEKEIASNLKKDKTGYTMALIEKLRSENADKSKIPDLLRKIIEDIIEMAR